MSVTFRDLTAAAFALMVLATPAAAFDGVGNFVKPQTPGQINAVSVTETHPNARLVLGNPDLFEVVEVETPRFRKLGALTQSAVTVRNVSQGRLTLEYKVDWFEEGWFPTNAPSTWHRFILNPNQVETFSTMGKTPTASHIQFTVRYPSDITVR